ncbi:hypothetical protein D9M72_645840 [compost metagenome]
MRKKLVQLLIAHLLKQREGFDECSVQCSHVVSCLLRIGYAGCYITCDRMAEADSAPSWPGGGYNEGLRCYTAPGKRRSKA